MMQSTVALGLTEGASDEVTVVHSSVFRSVSARLAILSSALRASVITLCSLRDQSPLVS
jgi:hypothetical protein